MGFHLFTDSNRDIRSEEILRKEVARKIMENVRKTAINALRYRLTIRLMELKTGG